MLPFDLDQAFRHGVRWSLVGSVGAAVLQLAQSVIFARLTGPNVVGDYTLAATVLTFLMPLADAGLSQAVVQARDLKPAQMATLGWLNVALGATILLLVVVAGPWLGAWYQSPDLLWLLLLMSSVLLVTPFGVLYSAVLVRDLRFDQSAKVELLGTASSLLVVAVLAWQGWGAWAMAWGFWVRTVVASVGGWWLGRRHVRFNWFKISSLRSVFPALRFGGFELSARLADAASNSTDKLIVGKWLGPAALAHYSQAFALYLIPTARVGYVVTRVAFPVFARLQDDRPALQAFFDRTNRQLQWLLAPLFVGLMLFSKEIVLLLYGPAWSEMAPLLVAFGAAGFGRSLSVLFPMLTRGVGRPDLQLGFLLAWTLALNAVLVLTLHYWPTAWAAVWSRLPAKLCFEVPLLLWLAARCGVRLGSTLQTAVQVWGRVGVCALLAVAVVALTALTGWWAMFVKALVFATGLLFWYRRVEYSSI